jgi:hypothetical protein
MTESMHVVRPRKAKSWSKPHRLNADTESAALGMRLCPILGDSYQNLAGLEILMTTMPNLSSIGSGVFVFAKDGRSPFIYLANFSS